MTAAYTLMDQQNIEARLWIAEDCHPLSATGLSKKTRRQERERAAKRAKVSAISDRFFDAVNSESPPQSRDEAIRIVVGTLGMLLSYLFPQLALAIRVAGWLWDFTHG